MTIICQEVASPARTTVADRPETFAPRASASSYLHRSAVLQRASGLVLLVAALPLLAVLVLLVRLTSRGPAIFRQTRVGRDGRPFTIYKLRTMFLNAEALTGPVWATTDDPRVTRVGRVLRRLHLDELPQLANVVKGEMGLIGPRPERPEFTTQLTEQVPGYSQRLLIRPGITGLAQVCLPADSDVESVRRKLAHDLRYIAEASWQLDLYILLRTALRMVGVRRELGSWLRLPARPRREVSAEAAQAQI